MSSITVLGRPNRDKALALMTGDVDSVGVGAASDNHWSSARTVRADLNGNPIGAGAYPSSSEQSSGVTSQASINRAAPLTMTPTASREDLSTLHGDPRYNQLNYQMQPSALPGYETPQFAGMRAQGGLFSAMSDLTGNLTQFANTGLQNRMARLRYKDQMTQNQFNSDLANRGTNNLLDSQKVTTDLSRTNALNRLTDTQTIGDNIRNMRDVINLSTGDW